MFCLIHGHDYDTCTWCYVDWQWSTQKLTHLNECSFHIYSNAGCVECQHFKNEQTLAALMYRNQIEQPVTIEIVNTDPFLYSFKDIFGNTAFDDIPIVHQPYALEELIGMRKQ